jgi:addiction module RelE/StbE family toxin
MALQVAWGREALDDIDAIAGYIGRDSKVYAATMVQRFLDAAERLGDFPGMGRALPELDDPDYRDWIVGEYRVVYRVEEDRVTIVGVVHGARLLLNTIGDRLPKRRRKKPD